MVKQFARAHVNVWALSPYVAADGQLVLGRYSDGRVEGRIGDGINPYMQLPSLSPIDQTGRFDRIAADAIAHGAIADGSTDTTAQLQAVIDEFPVIFLPAGVYVISNTLKIPSNRIIYGVDRDATIIQATLSMPNNLNLITNANTRTDGVEHTNYNVNIHLRGFTVDGRGDERSIVIPNDTHGCNIKLSCVQDSSIINVRSHDGVLHNIDVCASQYEPSWPAGSDGDVNYVPLGPSQRVLIADCVSHDSIRDDPITCHDSSDIKIERCRVYRTRPLTSGDIHGIEVDEGCYRVSVTDCDVYDHNVGIQVKGHTNTTPSRDVHLTRCRAFRCRASFHLYHDNPATIPVGKVSWAKNISLLDCESIDPEPKPDVVPDDLITCSVKVAGYRNVEIRNLICRGGTGEYANNIVLDFGCDDVVIDGVWAINVCQGSTGVGRGFITTASAYGQGSNRVRVHNVTIDPTGTALAIPVFRATNVATVVDIDGMTGKGSTGPMIWLGEIKENDRAVRLVKNGFTNLVTVGGGSLVGTWDQEVPYGCGTNDWSAVIGAAYTTTTSAADIGLTKTITVKGLRDVFEVEVSLDVDALTTATSPFVGRLNVNAVDRTAQMINQSPGVTGTRFTVTKTYLVDGLPAGPREFKVRASASTAGNYRINAVHSTMTIRRRPGLNAIG